MTVNYDDNLLSNLRTEVVGETLEIESEEIISITGGGRRFVEVRMPTLVRLDASGGSDVTGKDSVGRLVVDASGGPMWICRLSMRRRSKCRRAAAPISRHAPSLSTLESAALGIELVVGEVARRVAPTQHPQDAFMARCAARGCRPSCASNPSRCHASGRDLRSQTSLTSSAT